MGRTHLFQIHLSKKKQRTTIDKIAACAAFIYPLTGLPQLFQIYGGGNTSGVSIWSWIGFSVFSLFFLAYGIVHKVKPIIIVNFLWLFIDCLVVVGIMINRMIF